MNLKQFCALLRVLHQGKMVLLLLVLLLALAIANEVAIYNIGLITGDYYRILNEKDEPAFIRQTIKSLLLIVTISLLKSFKEYVASLLYVKWRAQLTGDLQDNYFLNLAFYRLNVLHITNQQTASLLASPSDRTVSNDNVDQRITQDVDKMTVSLSVMVPEIMVSPFIIVFYSYRCYGVSGLVGPVGCVTFFLLSTLINKWLITQVSRLVYAQERCEGDFRFQHLRIRNNAESIALLSGESMERAKCNTFLSTLINTQRSLIARQLGLKMSIYLCDYLGSILSFIAISIPLFAGLYNNLPASELSKLISENTFFTIYLINCFTRLIDLATAFSTFLGTAGRISELYQWFACNNAHKEEIEEVTTTDSCGNGTLVADLYQNRLLDDEGVQEEVYFDCRNVSIDTPGNFQNRCMLKNLNFKIKPRQNVLITGPSGVGKSALFRVLKNIWPVSGGVIQRRLLLDNPNSVMFIPSKPVLTMGSLAEQIVYPKVYRKEDYQLDESFHDRVLAIMRFLELEQSVLARIHHDICLDLNINWIDHLSAGEVQRLNLARVLYHRPVLVFLDESTTALPEEMEEMILKELIANSITLVTCGHRSSLKRFHHTELRINNAANWEEASLL